MLPINSPKRPTGNDDQATFMQKVYDRLFRKLVFHNSSTVTWKETENGFTAFASPGGSGGSNVQLCVITQLFGTDADMAYDYFGATPWNATSNNTSGSQIIVAKTITARGPASELIDGEEIFYNQYYNDVSRFSFNTDSQASEYQAIHTRYVAYLGEPPTLDGNNNPEPYPSGQTLVQSFVEVQRLQNATGVLDPNGNPIYYVERSPDRKFAYSSSLNGS